MRSSGRTGLVELLATWELTSLPGVPGLFRVMTRFRGLDELSLLGRVANSPGIALVPGLRDEVRGVLRKARDPSSVEPEFRQHVSDVVGKTSDALASYAAEQRETLQRDLLKSAAGLPQADRESIFQRLWASAGSGAGGRLDQVRAIDEARDLLDRAKKTIESDAAGGEGQRDQDDDPAAVAEARRVLEARMSGSAQLVAKATAAPPIARELLETVLVDIKTMLDKEKLTLRSLAEQTETLATLATDLEDGGFAAAFAAPGRSAEDPRGKERPEACAELLRLIASSTEELTRLAADLPTSRVIGFRTRLNDAEAAAHSDDSAAIERCLEGLKTDSKEIRRLAEQQRRFEDDRNAADAERMVREIESLEPVARGREAKRLRGLRADLGERKNRAKVAVALPTLAARIANAERLRLAVLLGRATRCSDKARGSMQAEMKEAENALAGEHLVAVAEAAAVLDRALRKTAPWRGPRGKVVAAVLFVAVLVLGVVGVRTMRGGTATASFGFEMAEGVDNVEMVLVRAGEIYDTIRVNGQRVDVSLPAGRFEVYVNGRYTGQVVKMPQDAGDIGPIKVSQ